MWSKVLIGSFYTKSGWKFFFRYNPDELYVKTQMSNDLKWTLCRLYRVSSPAPGRGNVLRLMWTECSGNRRVCGKCLLSLVCVCNCNAYQHWRHLKQSRWPCPPSSVCCKKKWTLLYFFCIVSSLLFPRPPLLRSNYEILPLLNAYVIRQLQTDLTLRTMSCFHVCKSHYNPGV